MSRILIIDDNRINRKKLRFAVTSLGYHGETAEGGEEGLLALKDGAFDAVLLDMLMPGMDGFEVLRALKADDTLRHVPVIVVSDLEGDTRSVSAAIEMGAEDFLPKNFDPVILNARLKASLHKKKFRDQELEYFRRINALTDAAERVEAGRFDEDSLNLAEEARNKDPIGRLALVFQGMASEIHAREVRLLRRIRTLQCSLVLLLCGAVAGLTPSLSRLSAEMGTNPFGMAVWVDAAAFVLCGMVVLFRGRLPRLSRQDIAFFVGWAFVVGIVQHIAIFVLAGHVPATFLTLAIGLEGLLVFCFAAIMRLEQATWRRILGLLLGLVGLGISLSQRMEGWDIQANIWMFAALLLPLIFAFETIAVAARLPAHVDPVSGIFIMFGFSGVMAVALAAGTGNFIPPATLISTFGAVILMLGVVTFVANVGFLLLLHLGGGVFSSQMAYVSAISGVFWGVLLLGETMSPLAWSAIVLVLMGMYLVGSKASDEPIIIKRDFAA